MGSPDWNESMVDIHLKKKNLWVYCPGHAGVKGNDWADRPALVGTATLTSGLLLDRYEMLRSLRHYLWAQSQGHHTIKHLEERGVESGSARRSSLKGRERAIVNRMNIGTVSKATLGEVLRDRVECIWVFVHWAVESIRTSEWLTKQTLISSVSWNLIQGWWRFWHRVELHCTTTNPLLLPYRVHFPYQEDSDPFSFSAVWVILVFPWST